MGMGAALGGSQVAGTAMELTSLLLLNGLAGFLVASCLSLWLADDLVDPGFAGEDFLGAFPDLGAGRELELELELLAN